MKKNGHEKHVEVYVVKKKKVKELDTTGKN